MSVIERGALVLLYVGLSNAAIGQKPLVYEKNGRLIYASYANEGDTNRVNRIPDFSFAGYQGGGVKIPNVKTILVLDPKPGDCRELIQEAIDQVSQKPLSSEGLRGAILLRKGLYPVEGSLVLKASGVVLRGEGNATDGTILLATQRSQHDFIQIQGDESRYAEIPGSRKKIMDEVIGAGSVTVTIDPGHRFSKGDAVIISRRPNDLWIERLMMAQYGWTARDYQVSYEREVASANDNTITINAPIVDPIDSKYAVGEVFKYQLNGRVEQCGVENLRIESSYKNDNDEEHGWSAVALRQVKNCWVRNVVAKYFGYACVNMQAMCMFNTVEDCAMIDPKSVTTGGRKYSFNIGSGSTSNLFQRCASWGGRHDYVTGSRVPGPNVFLDCVAENTFADIGPHHRWATGVLFDNIHGGDIKVQNRKAMGTGHGWAGAQTLFWNCVSSKEIKVESPPGARNWGIGCVANRYNGDGYWESHGQAVTPRSLYLAQLQQRSGKKAIDNIATSQQRNGTIATDLKQWARQIAAEKKIEVGAP